MISEDRPGEHGMRGSSPSTPAKVPFSIPENAYRRNHHILDYFEPQEGVTVAVKGQGNKTGPPPNPNSLHMSRTHLRQFQSKAKTADPLQTYFHLSSLAGFARKNQSVKPPASKPEEPRKRSEEALQSMGSIRPVRKTTFAIINAASTDRDELLLLENVRKRNFPGGALSHLSSADKLNRQLLTGTDFYMTDALAGNVSSGRPFPRVTRNTNTTYAKSFLKAAMFPAKTPAI